MILALSGHGQAFDSSVLRLLKLVRITRVARIARLLRQVPEALLEPLKEAIRQVMILLKGIGVASRSVPVPESSCF